MSNQSRDSDCPPRAAAPNRRELLQIAGCATAGSILSACGVDETQPMSNATCTTTPTARATVVDGAELLQVNQVKKVTHDPDLFFVTRDAKGLMALSPICPHAKFLVAFNETEGKFVCPHQGSRFAVDGSLLQGPAVKGLDHHPLCRNMDNKIVVEPGMTTDAATRLKVT